MNRKRVMPILFLGVLATALDIAILAPALRSIGEYFVVEDERVLSWVFILFTLFTQIGIPFMSWLSDVYGRRFAYTLCMGLFVAGVVVTISSVSFEMLLVGRAIQGLGVSGIVPTTSAVIGDLFPIQRRGRMLGIIGAVFGVAFLIGPILSGVLVPYGWQWPFAILLPLASGVFVLSWIRLPVSERRHAPLDILGILTLMIAITCITIGVNHIEFEALPASLIALDVLAYLAIAASVLVVFVFVEKSAKRPFVRLELFQNRQIVIACLISLGAGMSEAVFVFLPSFAVEAFAVTDRTASYMLMPLVLALAIGAPLSGRLVDKVGPRLIINVGTLCVALGLWILSAVQSEKMLYYLGIALVGLGLSGLLGSAVSYILLNESKASERTVVQGLSRMFKGLGRLLGGAMIGAIVASSVLEVTGYNRAFMVIAVVAIVLFLFSFGLRSRKQDQGYMSSQTVAS